MKKHASHGLLVAFVLAVAACQSRPSDQKNAATLPNDAAASDATARDAATNDAAVSESTKPAESGYADVNGLKMYYEVHGKGSPLVLLHGSYMNIPMNWARFIPPLARSRQVIVAEMQAHGRTRDTAREFSYEGMGDDVSGLLK